MQTVNKYLPIILAVVAVITLANTGITLNASQTGSGGNIKLWIETIISALAGLGSSGYLAKRAFTGGSVGSDPAAPPTFSESMAAIQVLQQSCGGCEESEKAIETLTVNVVKRLR